MSPSHQVLHDACPKSKEERKLHCIPDPHVLSFLHLIYWTPVNGDLQFNHIWVTLIWVIVNRFWEQTDLLFWRQYFQDSNKSVCDGFCFRMPHIWKEKSQTSLSAWSRPCLFGSPWHFCGLMHHSTWCFSADGQQWTQNICPSSTSANRWCTQPHRSMPCFITCHKCWCKMTVKERIYSSTSNWCTLISCQNREDHLCLPVLFSACGGSLVPDSSGSSSSHTRRRFWSRQGPKWNKKSCCVLCKPCPVCFLMGKYFTF